MTAGPSPFLARSAALLLAFAALLAGCAGEPDGTDPPQTQGEASAPVDAQSPQSPPATPAPPSPPAAPAATSLRMSGCTGWFVSPVVPGPRPSPRTPAGWEESPPQELATVHMLALDCARVGIGPFERPLRLLVEATSSFTAPAPCLASKATVPTAFFVANTVWLEDPEVAAHLAGAFALDAYVRPLTVDAASVGGSGGAHALSWSWGLEGEPESRVELLDGGPRAEHDVADLRLFWAAGGGVASLGIDFSVDSPAVAGLPARGAVQPPMLLHDGGRPFTWPATRFSTGSAEGLFSLYEDLSCERPA